MLTILLFIKRLANQLRNHVTVLLILIFTITSCNINESNNNRLEEQKEKKKTACIIDLNQKYNVGLCLDTLRVEYSFQLQEKIQDKLLLVDHIFLQDILKNDDSYLALIEVGFYPKFCLELSASELDCEKLIKLGKFESNQDAIMIVKIEEIIKSSTWGDNTNQFYAHGEIIDLTLVDDPLNIF